MSVATKNPETQLTITWPLLPDDFQLPDDPVEDENQPLLAAALRQPLTAISELVQDALIVSNFALCAGLSLPASTGEEPRTICKAPDWMYVRPVNPRNLSQVRRSYTPHTEGTIPQVVMEFLSATYGEEYSVEFTERVGKWFFYEQVIKVPRYVIFRPTTAHLEVYALESERYHLQTADANGRYWIPGLELFLGIWEGTHESRTGYWLRWWNAAGELLLWSEERIEQERQRAEQERQRAEKLAEKLRQAGIEIEDEG
ncbi:MAG: Uma2 family endonuclease [Actinomycetota bacterium]